jgi:hypothetical protein
MLNRLIDEWQRTQGRGVPSALAFFFVLISCLMIIGAGIQFIASFF